MSIPAPKPSAVRKQTLRVLERLEVGRGKKGGKATRKRRVGGGKRGAGAQ